MPRPRTPLGAHGAVKTTELEKGKWRARTRLRFPDGKLRQVERFAPTKGKAQAVLLEALTKLETPAAKDAVLTRETNLATLGEMFLKVKADTGRAPGSLRTYAQNLKIVEKHLGHLPVGEVTVMRLQSFMAEVKEAHGDGSVKGCRSVLSGMFGIAVRNDVLDSNPVREVESVAKKKGRRGAKALPIDSVERMISTVRADDEMQRQDMVDLWEFMSLVGCRIGEACALRWELVEWDLNIVTLGPSVVREKGKGLYIYEPAKTDESMRRIVIPARAMQLLRERREQLPQNKLGLAFPTMLGNLRDPSNTANRWRENRDRLGYPTFTSHGFRKTVATVLDSAGMSARDIAEYLGHKHPSMTQDVYMERNRQSGSMAEAITEHRKSLGLAA